MMFRQYSLVDLGLFLDDSDDSWASCSSDERTGLTETGCNPGIKLNLLLQQ